MVSCIEIMILGLISKKSMHGYLVSKMFEERGFDSIMHVNKGSIYKALRRLEKNKLISGKYLIKKENLPKKVYHITKKGIFYLRKGMKKYLLENAYPSKDFWHVIRFAQGNVTKEVFLESLQRIRNQLLIMHDDMVKKFREEDKNTKLPFYAPTFFEFVNKMHTIQIQTIEKILKLAEKPENQDTFLKEESK